MSTLSVTQDDGGPVVTALQQLVDTGTQLRPTMGAIARTLETRVKLGFRQGQSPYGEAWAPIRYRDGQPLRDTGQLQRSITSDYGDDYAIVGTNTEYAPVHQFGLAGEVRVPAHTRTITQAFGKPIPAQTVAVKAHTRTQHVTARPFFPLQGGEVDLPPAWEQSVLAHITRALEEATHG